MIEKAIILSAGQGSRLLPLTAERPKCLIDFSGRSLLAWQMTMLSRRGIREFHVVTGFMTDMVEAELNEIAGSDIAVHVHFNPFFKVADNLGSCWIARDAMRGDFLLLNGDTLISDAIVGDVLTCDERWPVTVTIDIKASYDSDDMKVALNGDKLLAIGKTLSEAQSDAESIGLLAFRGTGADLFREQVRAMMRTPAGVEHWYLKVIDRLAPSGAVGTCSIAGRDWAEVDFLTDIETATALTDKWAGDQR